MAQEQKESIDRTFDQFMQPDLGFRTGVRFCVNSEIYLSHFLAQNICQPHATKLDTFIRWDFSLNQFHTQASLVSSLSIWTQFDRTAILNKSRVP